MVEYEEQDFDLLSSFYDKMAKKQVNHPEVVESGGNKDCSSGHSLEKVVMSMSSVMDSDFICANEECQKIISIGETALKCSKCGDIFCDNCPFVSKKEAPNELATSELDMNDKPHLSAANSMFMD